MFLKGKKMTAIFLLIQKEILFITLLANLKVGEIKMIKN